MTKAFPSDGTGDGFIFPSLSFPSFFASKYIVAKYDVILSSNLV
jgi:hypothetical protein